MSFASPASLPKLVSAALILVLCLAFAPSAHAQLEIKIKTKQREYVQFEDIPVMITLTNRSGRDLTLGGPGGADWLDFRVFRGQRAVRRSNLNNIFEPTMIRNGQTMKFTVDIANYFTMTDFGFYTFQAAVWFSPARKYITSNRTSGNVVSARVLWDQTYGVTRDRPKTDTDLSEFESLHDDGGSRLMTLRTHKFMKFTGRNKSYLYYRLDDPSTLACLTCYRLAELIDIRKPMFAIDNDNHAHVLWMTRPQMYAKVEIDTRGNVLPDSVKYFKEKGPSIPRLQAVPQGGVAVVGGVEFDPDAAKEQKEATRRLSELPPGLEELIDMRRQLEAAE
ncbi:hypothetical protein [Sulfuriroseicoccus oceanibius]|uniref:Uncharacterized protein n=1 Tax=Sulfuriroseicoccus oceanibius TaxID=2707525 RepID=A0A6B3LGW3_9BACT|nr:hypothetical protein [Sulfuriroseicoccus oceanibius]QQL45658.1 hypothetical protein G3M56_003445 [Sulfuriroseicoccus oceanibius]